MGEPRIYRVEFDATTPPEGWDMAMAEEHPRFALWAKFGDGYREPRVDVIAQRPDGSPVWDPPRRRNFLSRSAVLTFAAELKAMGVPYRLLRSTSVEFEEI